MNYNKLSVIGIRSKSTMNSPTYFFSVESECVGVLKVALEQVKDTLEVYGYMVQFEGRYHDDKEGKK